MKAFAALLVFTLGGSGFVFAAGKSSEPKLRFNWPAPARFQVQLQTTKKGQRTGFVFTFAVARTNEEFLLECHEAAESSRKSCNIGI